MKSFAEGMRTYFCFSKQTTSRLIWAMALLALAMFFELGSARPGLAQGAGTGTIMGTVHDPSGAVVPGATLTLRDTAKDLVVRTLTSNPEGRYVVPFLVPSTYEITVEQAGFSKLVRSGITLRVGDSVEIDLQLQVATSTNQVVVTEAAPLLETSKTDVSQVVDQRMVQDLPLNGRRWDNFVLLTPGVTTDGGFGLVSYRGISGIYNDNKVDGADNNQAFFSEARGRTRIAYTYSLDSMAEFQVADSNYGPDFGQAAGGVVNAVTKSGTNNWHGDLFYYLRHFKLNALDSVSKSRGITTKPEKLRHQFGGSLGGPIMKDKMFFFGTYDGQRRTFPLSVINSDPKFINNFNTVCPTVATATQCSSAGGFLNSLTGPFPRVGNQDIFFGKLDYVVNQNNRLSVALNWHNWNSPNGIQTGPTITSSNLANGLDAVHDRFLVGRWTSAIRSNLANEFTFQWGQDLEFESPNFPAPSVSYSGGPGYGEPNFLPRPAFPNERRWQFTDNLSLVHGNHTLKVGFDFNAIHEVLINLFQGGGVYSYFGSTSASLKNWLADVYGINLGDGKTGKHYSSFTQAFDPITGVGKDDFWNDDYAGYAQDTWKISSKLTANLGVRYDLQSVPQPPKPNTATPLLAFYTSKINIDKNNLAPRIGLAWQPMHNTVVRLGYGVTFGKTTNSTFYAARVENGVFQQTFTCGPTTACAPIFPNLIFTPPGPTPVAPFSGALTPQVINTNPKATGTSLSRGLTPDFANPIVHMGELSIEREFPGQTAVSGEFLFSRGQRLPLFRDANLAPASTTKSYDVTDSSGKTLQSVTVPFYTTRLDNPSGVILNGYSTLNSWYTAFVLSVRKRYSHGLQFLANWTISKSIDNGQVIGTNGTFNGTDVPLDPLNQHQEYSLSDLDQRQRFVVNAIWDPPFKRLGDGFAYKALNGFRLSGIGTFASGFPVTGGVSGSPFCAGTGDFGVTCGEISSFGGFTGGRAPYIGRNTFTGPGLTTIDFRVARNFKINERFNLETLVEAFNLFNHTNFTGVNSSVVNYSKAGSGVCTAANGHTNDCLVPRSDFLVPFASGNTIYGARQMQVSMRLTF